VNICGAIIVIALCKFTQFATQIQVMPHCATHAEGRCTTCSDVTRSYEAKNEQEREHMATTFTERLQSHSRDLVAATKLSGNVITRKIASSQAEPGH